MKIKLVLFIPKSEWLKTNPNVTYDELIDLSDLDSFIQKDPLLWENKFRDFSSLQVGKKTILDLLQLESGLNIWFYHKFRIFYDNRLAFYELRSLKEHINTTDTFYIVSKNIPDSVFKAKNVKVINPSRGTNNKQKKNYFTLLKYGFLFLFRALLSSKRKSARKPNVILFQLVSERKIASINDISKSKMLSGIWPYLEEQYHSDFVFIEDIAFPSINKPFQLKWRMFRTKYDDSYTNEYILLKSFINIKAKSQSEQAINLLEKNLEIIKTQLDEPEDLLILNHFIRLHSTSKLYIKKYFAYNNFFHDTQGIESILAYSENLSQSKIVLDAATNNQVKTVGMQHGIIRPYNVGYSISKLEAQLKPMPDLTLVWGNYWKQQLINNANYQEETIKIVGQPRADIIPKMLRTYKRDNNLITFFSQLQPDVNEKYLAAKSFIETAIKHKSLNFVIKIHPAEVDDIYSILIAEFKADNVHIDWEKDTFQLLAESGIIMTCFSTVGGEALCFNTPVINFDSQGRDIAGYIKSEVTYWVRSESELNEVISKYEKNQLEKLPVENYVQDTFSAIDGNCSKRIRDIIIKG